VSSILHPRRRVHYERIGTASHLAE
jgi:hypothetical protein